MGIRNIFVMTHDSIGLGEDGPTHQPVEHLAALRAIPRLTVIRPADANETAVAWRVAIETRDRPVLLILSRQALPTLDRTQLAPADGLRRGAYVLEDAPAPELILIGTGSEVALVLDAARLLRDEGVSVRCVSMPSWELFEAQPAAYRERVLPASVRARVAVEAGIGQGWQRYLGDAGAMHGVERFGASAPGAVVQREYGFTPEAVRDRAREVLAALRKSTRA
jgi:transketolase